MPVDRPFAAAPSPTGAARAATLFAADSPVEEDGELLVPVVKRRLLEKWNQRYAAPCPRPDRAAAFTYAAPCPRPDRAAAFTEAVADFLKCPEAFVTSTPGR
jgi:hypothetical protein